MVTEDEELMGHVWKMGIWDTMRIWFQMTWVGGQQLQNENGVDNYSHPLLPPLPKRKLYFISMQNEWQNVALDQN